MFQAALSAQDAFNAAAVRVRDLGGSVRAGDGSKATVTADRCNVAAAEPAQQVAARSVPDPRRTLGREDPTAIGAEHRARDAARVGQAARPGLALEVPQASRPVVAPRDELAVGAEGSGE